MKLPVALDVMGGDYGSDVLVEGALAAVDQGYAVVLVGDRSGVHDYAKPRLGLSFVRAEHSVAMTDAPSAVRRLPESSARIVARLVQTGEACAAVSCGNTGASMVAAIMEMGLLPGIERPPVSVVLPRADGGRLVLLDAGANVDCRPEMLANFARVGAAYAQSLGFTVPRVGLLSNGEEDGKGNAQTRQVMPLLRASDLHVVGNIEPSDAMSGACDVLVCDGFVGNAVLKAAEGAAEIGAAVLSDLLSDLSEVADDAPLRKRLLTQFQGRMSWDSYGGGVLLGVDGVFVVGHGRATARAVAAAIALAHRCVETDVCGNIRRFSC
jgi:glycerol-3-phosphate acyltransferase PlsX